MDFGLGLWFEKGIGGNGGNNSQTNQGDYNYRIFALDFSSSPWVTPWYNNFLSVKKKDMNSQGCLKWLILDEVSKPVRLLQRSI